MATQIAKIDRYFSVEGMHCLKCVRKIQALGERTQAIESLNVDLSENRVTTLTRESFVPSEFVKKLENTVFVFLEFQPL